jgi:hypothetical protein
MFVISEILEYAAALGLPAHSPSRSRVDVQLSPEFILIFENQLGGADDDTIIRFEAGWHTHGDIMAQTLNVEERDVPSTILDALKSGDALLVAESYPTGVCIKGLEFKSHLSIASVEGLDPGESILYFRLP